MQRATCQKWQKLEIFYRKTEATSKRESVITNSNFKASYFTALKEIFTVWHTHKKDFRFLWVVCSLLTALSGVIFKIGFTTHPPGYLGWVSMAEHLHPSFKSPSTMQSVVDLRTGDKFSWVTTLHLAMQWVSLGLAAARRTLLFDCIVPRVKFWWRGDYSVGLFFRTLDSSFTNIWTWGSSQVRRANDASKRLMV